MSPSVVFRLCVGERRITFVTGHASRITALMSVTSVPAISELENAARNIVRKAKTEGALRFFFSPLSPATLIIVEDGHHIEGILHPVTSVKKWKCCFLWNPVASTRNSIGMH